MSLLMTFADNVRQIRKRKKLPQREIAGAMNSSISYVSMLERGQRVPPLETIEAIAKALGVPPRSLLVRNGRNGGRAKAARAAHRR